MDLTGLLTAIEDIFYDFVSWIAMYPRTALQALLRPGQSALYVSAEFRKPPAERFQSYLNPFVFWTLSMILFMWSVTTEALTFTVEAFVLTMIVFAMLPAIMAGLMMRVGGIPFTRQEFRRPLYIQMLIFGTAQTLLALDLALATPLVSLSENWSSFLQALAILMAGLLWFAVLAAVFLWIPLAEARAFMKDLDRPFNRVIGPVLLGLLLCGLLLAAMPLISSEIDLLAGLLQFSR